MSKKKGTDLVTIEAAQIIGGADATANIPVPEMFKNAPGSEGFDPVVVFESPGQYVFGKYRGMAQDVGPNRSRLYTIDIGNGNMASVWGATVLDKHMDKLDPAHGASILIQYLGTGPGKEGQDPPKLYRVRVQ